MPVSSADSTESLEEALDSIQVKRLFQRHSIFHVLWLLLSEWAHSRASTRAARFEGKMPHPVSLLFDDDKTELAFLRSTFRSQVASLTAVPLVVGCFAPRHVVSAALLPSCLVLAAVRLSLHGTNYQLHSQIAYGRAAVLASGFVCTFVATEHHWKWGGELFDRTSMFGKESNAKLAVLWLFVITALRLQHLTAQHRVALQVTCILAHWMYPTLLGCATCAPRTRRGVTRNARNARRRRPLPVPPLPTLDCHVHAPDLLTRWQHPR